LLVVLLGCALAVRCAGCALAVRCAGCVLAALVLQATLSQGVDEFNAWGDIGGG